MFFPRFFFVGLSQSSDVVRECGDVMSGDVVSGAPALLVL